MTLIPQGLGTGGGGGGGGGTLVVDQLPPIEDIEIPTNPEETRTVYVLRFSREGFVADLDEDGNPFWREFGIDFVEFELAALASIHTPAADSPDGLHVLLSDPVAIDAVPPVLGAQRQSTDADLQTGGIPGGTVEWANPPVSAGRPAHHPTSSIAFYDSTARKLGYSDGTQYTDADDIPEGDTFFNSNITWVDANTTNAGRFAPGTGRFDTRALAQAYIFLHQAEFFARYEAGVRFVAYYNTIQFRIDHVNIDSIGALEIPPATIAPQSPQFSHRHETSDR